jgi:hypothetical protein
VSCSQRVEPGDAGVSKHRFVMGYQATTFRDRLRDEQPIEWIVVMTR